MARTPRSIPIAMQAATHMPLQPATHASAPRSRSLHGALWHGASQSPSRALTQRLNRRYSKHTETQYQDARAHRTKQGEERGAHPVPNATMIRFHTPTADAPRAAADCRSCTTVAEMVAAASFAAEPTGSRVLCRCLRVTEAMVDEAISAGVVQSLRDVIVCTGAGDGCTACRVALRDYLARRGVAG